MALSKRIAGFCLAGAACVAIGLAADSATTAARRSERAIAVTLPDIEAIVRAVGGHDVATFSLFRGCILRRDLLVEPDAMDRLLAADAVVWTGFFGESSAIAASLDKVPAARRAVMRQPAWIDVSRDAARVNVPVSSCEGYVEPQFMYGDPFFWLNPRNGAVIARNVADGLARLQPDRRQYYADNAERFSRALDADIARWVRELDQVRSLRIFSTQCGWQNLAQLGGPTFLSCRKPPGALDTPEALAAQINEQSVDLIIVDPNTPPEYAEAFRARTRAKVVTVPSSVGGLPGSRSYAALFDNFLDVLTTAAVAH